LAVSPINVTGDLQLDLFTDYNPRPAEPRSAKPKKIKQADTAAIAYQEIRAEGKWNRDMRTVLLALSNYLSNHWGEPPTALELARGIYALPLQQVRSRLTDLKTEGFVICGAKRRCTANPKRRVYTWLITDSGWMRVREIR
jgi:hypothetical protein